MASPGPRDQGTAGPGARRSADLGELGLIARARGRFDEAEQLFHAALERFERFGVDRDVANGYHNLGTIAQERQRFDEAERLYQKALEVLARLGHPTLMTRIYTQFAVLRRLQIRYHEAVAWLAKAWDSLESDEVPIARIIVENLAAVMSAMGEDEFVDAWRQAFGQQEPPLELLREVADRLDGGAT